MPNTHKSALWVLAALIALIVLGFIFKYFNPDIDLIAYIGGISTLAVALLTVAYVLTTSNQLSVMNRQLEEMKKGREYQAQPLPILHDVEVSLERPRVFYTPPEARYSAQSRAKVKFRIKNEGSHPAINTVLTAWIRLSPNNGMSFDSSSRLVEVVAEGGSYPPTEGGYDSFLFPDDHDGKLIGAIRDKNLREPPVLKVRTIFRNTLGACYTTTSLFMLYMKDADDEPILTNWHSSIVAFSVNYKSALEQLPKLFKRDRDEWERIFETVKEEFAAQVKGPESLSLSCIAIPTTFSVEPMSSTQYENEIKELGFGGPIPSWFEGCVHDDEENG